MPGQAFRLYSSPGDIILIWQEVNFYRQKLTPPGCGVTLQSFARCVKYHLIFKIFFFSNSFSLRKLRMDLNKTTKTECRICGACCIAQSISSIIPETSQGKPAGTRCVHLSAENRCRIYNERPQVCRDFTATVELCGSSFSEAMANLTWLENATKIY